MNAFARYDLWRTNYPQATNYPLQCTACREYSHKSSEDFDETVHCVDDNNAWAKGTTCVGVKTPEGPVCLDCWDGGKPVDNVWLDVSSLDVKCVRCHFDISLAVGVLMQDTSYDYAYDDPRL